MALVDGSTDTFDGGIYREALAALTGVPAHAISISVQAGSLFVTATLDTPSGGKRPLHSCAPC